MSRKMLRLRERWEHFWFEPASPFNLGFCRALFFGAIFLHYLPRDFSVWAEVEDAFWKPIWLFSRLHLPALSGDLLVIIQALWKAALGLSCIGLFTRFGTITSFILGLYLLGLPHNFGKTSHSDAILVFVFGIMALSRCGDSLSVEQLARRVRYGSRPPSEYPVISGEYTWPIRMIWLVMALIFFAAGVSKIRHSGMEWITSDNMAILLMQSHYHKESLITLWGIYIAQYSWLCQSLAAATIVFETCYPLALFSRRARWIVVPAMASIQIGIRLVMGIAFRQFLICNIFWVPWDQVGVAVRSVGAVGIIMIAIPDWINKLGPLFGNERGPELAVYLSLSVFAFLCLVYYSLRKGACNTPLQKQK